MFGFLPHQMLHEVFEFDIGGFPLVDFLMALPYSFHILILVRLHNVNIYSLICHTRLLANTVCIVVCQEQTLEHYASFC